MKVARGRAVDAFRRAYHCYRTGAAENPSPMDFAAMLENDIRRRRALRQFGFDRLHPTTYLNQARWEDDYPPPEPTTGNQKPTFNDDDTAWAAGLVMLPEEETWQI